jgi:hypothetical protein
VRRWRTPERDFGTWIGDPDDVWTRAAEELVSAGQADSTRRNREFALARFDEFCCEERVANIPASTHVIIAFLNALPGWRSHGNLASYALAIRDRQLAAGLEDPLTPALAQALVGFRRQRSGAVQQHYALEADQVAALVHTIRTFPMSRDDPMLHLCRLRDIALVLLTFSQNLQFHHSRHVLRAQLLLLPKSIVVRCRDEVGRDLFIGPGRDPRTCPVTALRQYLGARADTSPYVFAPHKYDRGQPLGPTIFTTSLRRYARAAGIPARLFSPTSLRRGAVRAAVAAGADPGQTLSHLGIRSMAALERVMRCRRSPAFGAAHADRLQP